MATTNTNTYTHALSSNAAWSSYKSHQNPSFFPNLSTGQYPEILWLGCSDSRVPETTILGLAPGDVFVHRNIANIISPTDINSSAVIEFAVVHVGVKHIVLCGHSCCGGANAALSDSKVGGVLDTWLTPLKKVRKENTAELESIKDAGARAIRMAELNVAAGVETLLANYVVDEAIQKRSLQVHGVLFDIATGKIRELGGGSSQGGSFSDAVEKKEVRGRHGMLMFGDSGAEMSIR